MKKLIAVLIVLLAAISFSTYKASENPLPVLAVFHSSAPTAPPIFKSDPEAPVYGHPMVPGGIHSLEDLYRNAALYSHALEVPARFTTLSETGFYYVSYLKNGKVYWTKNPRILLAGEPILVVGNQIILQRCGNLARKDAPPISETLADEPKDVYPLATPDDPGSVLDLQPAPPPDSPVVYPPPSSGQPGAALFMPNTIIPPAFPPSPEYSVSEPSTLDLTILGFVVIVGIAWYLKRPEVH